MEIHHLDVKLRDASDYGDEFIGGVDISGTMSFFAYLRVKVVSKLGFLG